MNAPTLRCALCSTVRRPRVHHPYLPMRSLCVCTTCKQHVCSRFQGEQPEAAGLSLSSRSPTPTSPDSTKGVAPNSPEISRAASLSPSQCIDVPAPAADPFSELHPQVARLIVLVEKLLWCPSDDKDLKPLRERIRYDYRKGLYKSPTNHGIDDRLLSAAASVFPLIGIALQKGRLNFPQESVALPKISDVRERIEVSYASLMGPAEAWNNMFPHLPWESELSSHIIFTQLLSLFGLSVMPEKRASRRRGDGSIILERNSVIAVLDAAVASIPLCLSSVIVTPGRKPRDHNLMCALVLSNKSKDIPPMEHDQHRCACCGNGADKERYPFRFITCVDCPRKLCSLCLEHVMGAGEYVRGLTSEEYRCPLCRVSYAATSVTEEESSLQVRRERRRAQFLRSQLEAIAEDKPPKQRGRPRFPPLALSRTTCRSLQRFSAPTRAENGGTVPQRGVHVESPAPSRDQVGFAKLCEDINIAAFSSPMSSSTFPPQKRASELTPRSTTVCMACRLPLGVPVDYDGRMNYCWNVYDASSSDGSGLDGLKVCQVPECGIILHEQCMRAVKVVGMTSRAAADRVRKNHSVLANGARLAGAPDAILDTEKEKAPDCSTDSNDKEDAEKHVTANDRESRRKTRAAGDKMPIDAAAAIAPDAAPKANGDVSANEACKQLDCAWKCGRHVCKSCGSPDVAVRCRTCTTAYCGAHAPVRDEIHLFGLNWMACESCKDYLEAPRVPFESDANTKFRAGANSVTIADALERERTISLTMINDLANLHSTLDSRDPTEMRVGIQKVHNQRARRELRDSVKRTNAARAPTANAAGASGPALDVQGGRIAKSRPPKEHSRTPNGKPKNSSNGAPDSASGAHDDFGSKRAVSIRPGKRSRDTNEDNVTPASGEPIRSKSLRNGLRPGANRPPTSRGSGAYRSNGSKAGASRAGGSRAGGSRAGGSRAGGSRARKANGADGETVRRANGGKSKRGLDDRGASGRSSKRVHR